MADTPTSPPTTGDAQSPNAGGQKSPGQGSYTVPTPVSGIPLFLRKCSLVVSASGNAGASQGPFPAVPPPATANLNPQPGTSSPASAGSGLDLSQLRISF